MSTCQDQLRRDGDQYSFDVSYLFKLGEGSRHLLRPMVRYTIEDREGDAISGDAYRLQLSYVFLGEGYTVASNVIFGGSGEDARNPLFGVTTDSDRYAVDTTLFYRLPAESGRWQAVGSDPLGQGRFQRQVLRRRGVQRQCRRDVSFRRPVTPDAGESRPCDHQPKSLILPSSIGRPSPSTSCQSLRGGAGE